MMNKRPARFLITTAALSTLLVACDSATQSEMSGVIERDECLRECLESTIENYLQALAAQDVSRIEVTDDVVFSENNQIMELGDGSWQTFTGSGSYRHYFADPQTQQVAVISTMRENGQGVIYDLRLKLEDGLIAEIESMVIRTPGGAATYEELGDPPPNFRDIIPVEERNTREELLALPYKYLNGMENNDPNGDYSFFAADCNRYEHAVKTTNDVEKAIGHTESTTFSTMTCEDQFSGGGLAFVTRIRDERYDSRMVVDEEKQAIFGFVVLDHNGTVPIDPPYFHTPRGLKVGEGWRVRDNELFEIEMTLIEVPYGERPNFGLEGEDDSWLESTNLNPNNLRVPEDCNRSCMNDLTRDFLDALVSHDYSQLPLSPTVQYRENGQALAVGDGLWGTMTELNDYQLFLANPQAGDAAFFGTVTETDVPGLLSASLKVTDGLIEDINVTVMRQEFNTARGGTLSLFYPQIRGMFNPDRFTSMEPQLGSTGFSREQAIREYIDSVSLNNRDTRILAIDSANGLALVQSIRDVPNSSDEQTDESTSGSYSVMTSSLYKFSSSEILLTKSVSRPMPYRMPL
jgi:hypothetical protein